MRGAERHNGKTSVLRSGARTLSEMLATACFWSAKRWLAVGAVGLLWLLASGIPTGIIETPLYERMTPVYWWNYPFWVLNSALVGLLAATYVSADSAGAATGGRFAGGGLLSVVAIGCPVCNKLVVLALGAGGTMSYFAPIQPVLGFLSTGLLLYALGVRLSGETYCPIPVTAEGEEGRASTG